MASLRRRFARFRRTAFPTRRAATNPTCGGPSDPGARSTVIPPERLAVPERKTVENRVAGLNETNGRPVLGSELPPAFEATTFDHGAPGTSPHARAKSVLALSATHVGLVGTLHCEVSPIGRSRCDREDSGRHDSTPLSVLSVSTSPEREVQRRIAKSSVRPRNIAAPRFGANRSSNPIVGIIPSPGNPCPFCFSSDGRPNPSRPTVRFPRLAGGFVLSIYSPPVVSDPPYLPGETSPVLTAEGASARTDERISPHPVDRYVDMILRRKWGISGGRNRLVHRGMGDVPPTSTQASDAGRLADMDRTAPLER